MRTSEYFLSTLRDPPADAELISHQLMLRAGLIRKLSAGLYTWLPLGLKVLNNVQKVVKEEMEKTGALEMLMPAVQPAELWQESGRWQEYGAELLKIKDRHERDFCFGPTHEEVITHIMRHELQSYKQLPITFFQIQTKFRDEIRPRFGIMRAREFLMKDAYSFHVDDSSLEQTYNKMFYAYSNICERLGLQYRAVLADTGSIGGNQSHEFHVLADAGEDVIAYCPDSDYAANTEKATALQPEKPNEKYLDLTLVDTPTAKTIHTVCQQLKLPKEKSLKALIVKGKTHPVVLLLLRGDHELNEIKASKLEEISLPLTFASDAEITQYFHCEPGFIGPINIKDMPIIVDRDAAVLNNFVCGANQKDKHYTNANWDRDCHFTHVADLRQVVEGDLSPDGKGHLQLTRGVEVGHIFQLGTKYSEAMDFTVLDQHGKAKTPFMGCYGVGVSRIVAAAIEQRHDDRGIIWPEAMAPFDIAIVPIGYHKSAAVKKATDEMYQKMSELGLEVLLDDRQERPGVMFTDMDLIGIPKRIVIGEKNLANGQVEYKRRTDDNVCLVAINEVTNCL